MTDMTVKTESHTVGALGAHLYQFVLVVVAVAVIIVPDKPYW